MLCRSHTVVTVALSLVSAKAKTTDISSSCCRGNARTALAVRRRLGHFETAWKSLSWQISLDSNSFSATQEVLGTFLQLQASLPCSHWSLSALYATQEPYYLNSSALWVVRQHRLVKNRRFGTTYRSIFKVQRSWTRPLKMGTIGGSETSVINQPTLCNNPEDRRIEVKGGESLGPLTTLFT